MGSQVNAKPSATEDCGHKLDCSALPPGLHSDPYNCRKYWNCDGNQGTHYTCDDDQLYDAKNHWCDFPENVDCHQRPICDDCDENCHFAPTTTQASTDKDPTDCSEYCLSDWGDFEMGCCNYYFCKCSYGRGTVIPCQNTDTVFVQGKDYCDWRYNVPCCNK